MTAGYAGLFKTRHVPSLVVSSVMARMPLGSSVMLIVLLVNAQYGASAAGTATALMTGAMAVCAPMLGKLIDRGRAPVALVALGVVQFSCVIGLVVATQSQAPFGLELPVAATRPLAGDHAIEARLRAHRAVAAGDAVVVA